MRGREGVNGWGGRSLGRRRLNGDWEVCHERTGNRTQSVIHCQMDVHKHVGTAWVGMVGIPKRSMRGGMIETGKYVASSIGHYFQYYRTQFNHSSNTQLRSHYCS